jgi:hypothetical protein
MRTTLDLDDDVLQAIKELAEHRRSTVGKVASDLVRRALAPRASPTVRNGVPVLRTGRPARRLSRWRWSTS